MPEHDPDTDTQLMAALADGNGEALRTLVDRWQQPLSGFAFRYVHDMEAARDIVQETFLRVYKARAQFRADMKFSSWVFRIASNLCNNHMRWRRRHPGERLDGDCSDPAEESGGDASRPDPADTATGSDERELLAKAVSEMPHKLKTTLLLYYYQGLSYRDIATSVGCSERGVETRLYRARAWLQQRLGPVIGTGGDDPAPRSGK